jgi:Flp pilus assembly protein TadG
LSLTKFAAKSVISKIFLGRSKKKCNATIHANKRYGSILIEFAFGIPVLVSILFLVMDAPKFYYLKYKVKNTAYMASSLLQRGVERAIIRKDLSQIFSAAFFSHFPGTSQYYINSQWAMGYTKIAHVYYVVGSAKGKAQVKWGWKSNEKASNPNDNGTIFNTSQSTSVVKFLSFASDPNSIYKHLSLDEDEARIIIDVGFYLIDTTTTKNGGNGSDVASAEDEIDATASTTTDSTAGIAADAKKCMGFSLLPLRSSADASYFNFVLVFTPKKGLFTETAPK